MSNSNYIFLGCLFLYGCGGSPQGSTDKPEAVVDHQALVTVKEVTNTTENKDGEVVSTSGQGATTPPVVVAEKPNTTVTSVNEVNTSNTTDVVQVVPNSTEPEEPKEGGRCIVLNTPQQYFSVIRQATGGKLDLKIDTKPPSDDLRFSTDISSLSLTEPQLKSLVTGLVTATQVEDIKRQLEAANIMYSQVLGLKKPLNQTRYEKAKAINVNFFEHEKAYGLAYDEVISNRQLGTSDCFVKIKITDKVQASQNGTPAHELFHIYHNGQMMFKQAWLSEGLARWSESMFKTGVGLGSTTPLPKNRTELLAVMDQSYGASKMWTRLFREIDGDATFTVPSEAANMKYIAGKSLIADNKAYGTKFIATLFNALGEQSLAVSKQKDWPIYGWKEVDQKSADLNPYIWTAIKNAVNKQVPKGKQSPELKQFLAIEL